eukprot:CAMPEP_0206586288 /NCGR_PEP_ID=MMETSP0325_2-20121206/36929_1 /ASSEMBLY_ACC=CAM_ASM_000347 /TAXON_ID=2866 /ORGANISM="Crypthecodinium cohnii, Strain Seligo" /LENGTH=130 /DNA_ID=CAMNT_0054094009 /DNA_START=204 /DNA_END=596 /DNA_ORIENTATION=-
MHELLSPSVSPSDATLCNRGSAQVWRGRVVGESMDQGPAHAHQEQKLRCDIDWKPRCNVEYTYLALWPPPKNSQAKDNRITPEMMKRGQAPKLGAINSKEFRQCNQPQPCRHASAGQNWGCMPVEHARSH